MGYGASGSVAGRTQYPMRGDAPAAIPELVPPRARPPVDPARDPRVVEFGRAPATAKVQNAGDPGRGPMRAADEAIGQDRRLSFVIRGYRQCRSCGARFAVFVAPGRPATRCRWHRDRRDRRAPGRRAIPRLG